MTNTEIKNLLNTVYEIEGIAEMALNLPDNAKRAALCGLIAEKSYRLANMAAETGIENAGIDIDANADMGWNSQQAVEAIEREEEEDADISPAEEERPEPVMPPPSTAIDQEVFGIPTELDDDDEDEHPEPEDAVEEDEKPAADPVDQELKSGDIFSDDEQDDNPDEPLYAEDDFEDDYDTENEEIERRNFVTSARGDIRKMFTISDKYRFVRELFENRTPEYMANLDLIMTMPGYEDAEDYFYNDLQWDPESPDVVDFMAIVKRYFS